MGLFAALAREAKQRLRELSAQCIANRAWAFAKLEQLDKIVKIGDQTVAPDRALGDDRELTLQLKSPAP